MKKKLRYTSIIMFIIAVMFVCYAFNHPEAGWNSALKPYFPFLWDAKKVLFLYKAYAVVTVLLFLASFIVKDKQR